MSIFRIEEERALLILRSIDSWKKELHERFLLLVIHVKETFTHYQHAQDDQNIVRVTGNPSTRVIDCRNRSKTRASFGCCFVHIALVLDRNA